MSGGGLPEGCRPFFMRARAPQPGGRGRRRCGRRYSAGAIRGIRRSGCGPACAPVRGEEEPGCGDGDHAGCEGGQEGGVRRPCGAGDGNQGCSINDTRGVVGKPTDGGFVADQGCAADVAVEDAPARQPCEPAPDKPPVWQRVAGGAVERKRSDIHGKRACDADDEALHEEKGHGGSCCYHALVVQAGGLENGGLGSRESAGERILLSLMRVRINLAGMERSGKAGEEGWACFRTPRDVRN